MTLEQLATWVVGMMTGLLWTFVTLFLLVVVPVSLFPPAIPVVLGIVTVAVALYFSAVATGMILSWLSLIQPLRHVTGVLLLLLFALTPAGVLFLAMLVASGLTLLAMLLWQGLPTGLGYARTVATLAGPTPANEIQDRAFLIGLNGGVNLVLGIALYGSAFGMIGAAIGTATGGPAGLAIGVAIGEAIRPTPESAAPDRREASRMSSIGVTPPTASRGSPPSR